MAYSTVEITLPSSTVPVREQIIIGKVSTLLPDLEEFRGIPFGYIPGRWRQSELRVSLPSDKFDATRNGPKCPQSPEPNNSRTYQSYVDFPNDVTESEFECLNLFVVRPSKEALARIGRGNVQLPVLIWIHGGAFGFGAGTDPMWDPSRLVLESLTLGTPFIGVCLNYRLNLFGFAASTDLLEDQTNGQRKGCNFGLRDQQLGIEWVSRNIISFGGDPAKITIGGQSAGAASTHAHTLSAMLKPETPLFRRSIIQSGSLGCLGPAPLAEANANWHTLCQHLGFGDDGESPRLERLRALPAEELLQAQKELGWMAFPVVIDGETIAATDADCEVTIDFDDSRKSTTSAPQPSPAGIEIMLGDADEEGTIFAPNIKNITNYAQVLDIFTSATLNPDTINAILNAYSITSFTPLSTIHSQLYRIVGDTMFGLPLYKTRKFFASAINLRPSSNGSASQIYHPLKIHPYKIKFGNPFPGPSQNVSHHCVDLIYLFDAFHDDLVAIDTIGQGLGQQLTPPLDTSSMIDTAPTKDAITPPWRTNQELKTGIQSKWIHFITHETPFDEIENNPDQITIYDTDRSIKVQSLSRDKEWIQQRERFEILAKDMERNRRILKALTGSLII